MVSRALIVALVCAGACSRTRTRGEPTAGDARATPVPADARAMLAPPVDAPPAAPPVVVPAGVVDLADVDPTIRVDMMYAGSNNFLGRPVAGYRANRCYVTSQAATALRAAQARLRARALDHALLVRDCYRPPRAVADFVAWAADPADVTAKAAFYPDVSKPDLLRLGYIAPVSGHARASSIDLTIVVVADDGSERPLDMGSAVDFFGERSHTAFAGVSPAQRANRDLLLAIMTPEFKNYAKEWWHFVLRDEPAIAPLTFDVAAADAPASLYAIDPRKLAAWDADAQAPLALAHLLDGIHRDHGLPVPVAPDRSNATLAAFDATYGAVAAQVAADIDRIVTDLAIDWEDDVEKTYRPAAAKTDRGRVLRRTGDVARVLQPRWLTSRDGRFVLAGVVLRPDRRDFDPRGCGEVRFIYRLAYGFVDGGEVYASRLPFTVNVVYTLADDGAGCRDAVRWQPPDLAPLRFEQLELNAQVVRFPSGLEAAEARGFAGQAIYLMRIFRLDGGRLRPARLENTPDVAAIANDPAKRAQLAAFIASHAAEIDEGVFQLPDELLADVALSYSTHGSARRANRPFDALFTPAEAAALARPGGRFVTSGASLLERLNGATCMGCHQSASTAGFHFLGPDRDDLGDDPARIATALEGNRVRLPFSPHSYAELARRTRHAAALAAGAAPDSFRPHPAAPAGGRATVNQPCPLAANDLGPAARWQCADGLTCDPVVTSTASFSLGLCMPPSPAAGLACRRAAIAEGTAPAAPFAANLRAFTDRVTGDAMYYPIPEQASGRDDVGCRPTRIGVPLGRVQRRCRPDERSLAAFATGAPPEMCAILGGKGFEAMAMGTFSGRRFADAVVRGVLDTCSPTRPCREDYICQAVPRFLVGVAPATFARLDAEQLGFCTPTYFVYQLRLDGHPDPR